MCNRQALNIDELYMMEVEALDLAFSLHTSWQFLVKISQDSPRMYMLSHP